MPDFEQKNQNDFLIEKIKVKPVNKKKLMRRMLITVSMAIIFGLVACVTFLILEPVLSNWIYPKEEGPQIQDVVFPEDKEEMSPEEMLAENLPTETPEMMPTPVPEDGSGQEEGSGQGTEEAQKDPVILGEEQVQGILDQVALDLDSYKEIYSALSEYVNEVSRSVVTVTAVKSSTDWLMGEQESLYQCSGAIISENGIELLILTDYTAISSARQLILTFYDESQAEAQLKQHNKATNLAVLSVALEDLSDKVKEELPIVQFGNSNLRNLAGTPVVAVGSPMGISNSVGYGMITSAGTTLSMTDRNYKLLLTDISGSRNASGVLFDLQGQMVGFITNGRTGTDLSGLITAYGITELRMTMTKLSNASLIAYMGVKGGDVPREANQELGVPFGAYVEEIDMDSPAMRAGIQRGDVIIAVDDKSTMNFNAYSNILMQLEPGQMVTVSVMRQGQGEYREMEFSIELGGVN